MGTAATLQLVMGPNDRHTHLYMYTYVYISYAIRMLVAPIICVFPSVRHKVQRLCRLDLSWCTGPTCVQ